MVRQLFTRTVARNVAPVSGAWLSDLRVGANGRTHLDILKYQVD